MRSGANYVYVCVCVGFYGRDWEGMAGWLVCFGEMDCRMGVGEGLFLG